MNRNCGCGYNNLDKPADIPLTCRGFNMVSEEPTELMRKDLSVSLAEFLMIVEQFSYSELYLLLSMYVCTHHFFVTYKLLYTHADILFHQSQL